MLFQKLVPLLLAGFATAGLIKPFAQQDSIAKRSPTNVRIARNQFNPRLQASRTRVKRQGPSALSCATGFVDTGLAVCVRACVSLGGTQNVNGGCTCNSPGFISLDLGLTCVVACNRGTGYLQNPLGGCSCDTTGGFVDVGAGICQRACTSVGGVQNPLGGCICTAPQYTSLDGGATCVVACNRGTGYVQNPAGGCSCAANFIPGTVAGTCVAQCPAGSGGVQNPAGGCTCGTNQIYSSVVGLCVTACLSTVNAIQNPAGGCTCSGSTQLAVGGTLCLALDVAICTRSIADGFTQTLLPNVPGCIGTLGSVCGQSGPDVSCPLLSACVRQGLTNNYRCQAIL